MLVFADSLKLEELKKDTAGIFESAFAQTGDIKGNATSLLQQTDISEMRKDFSMISESIYPFLKSIGYEGRKLYWQNCPMAFGDDKAANWISNSAEIQNPYLGKKSPTYGSGMLNCGSTLDSLEHK